MLVGEVLQCVPVLVVDFILQPGNESSKEKESAGLRGALRSTPRCRLPAASGATPRWSRPGSPGSPVRLPHPLPAPARSPSPPSPLRGRTAGEGTHPPSDVLQETPQTCSPLPPPSAAHAPARETSPLCHSRGWLFPSGSARPGAQAAARTRVRVPGAGLEPSSLRGGDGAVSGSPAAGAGDRAPLLPAGPAGTGGLRLLFFVERCLCPLRSRQFRLCPSPPAPALCLRLCSTM